MLALIASPKKDSEDSPTVLDWLNINHQSEQVIERFWKIILVSALAESLERASLAAARQVFVNGFLAHRDAGNVLVPILSLNELYQDRVGRRLRENGVQIQVQTPIAAIAGDENLVAGVQMPDLQVRNFDTVVLAVPWTRVGKLLSESMIKRVDPRNYLSQINGSPITSVHLWFDRPVMDLPNAIFVERLSQWIFARTQGTNDGEFYYQVVVSASHDLAGRDRAFVVADVCADLASAFPQAAEAKLIRSKLITEDLAVFSVRPGLHALRPPQTTPIPNLILAGDWTNTGWPATMEGAVRSGYLAAEAVLKQLGRLERILVPDLPRNWLTRWL
jgi:squalene-associated FAD-dependent desaturase